MDFLQNRPVKKLKQSKNKNTPSTQRRVQIKQSSPPKIKFHYDKKTFDYTIMFISVQDHNRNRQVQRKTYKSYNNYRNTSQSFADIRERSRLSISNQVNQEQQQQEKQQFKQQQINKSKQNGMMILEELQQEEQKQKQQKQRKQKQQRKQRQEKQKQQRKERQQKQKRQLLKQKQKKARQYQQRQQTANRFDGNQQTGRKKGRQQIQIKRKQKYERQYYEKQYYERQYYEKRQQEQKDYRGKQGRQHKQKQQKKQQPLQNSWALSDQDQPIKKQSIKQVKQKTQKTQRKQYEQKQVINQCEMNITQSKQNNSISKNSHQIQQIQHSGISNLSQILNNQPSLVLQTKIQQQTQSNTLQTKKSPKIQQNILDISQINSPSKIEPILQKKDEASDQDIETQTIIRQMQIIKQNKIKQIQELPLKMLQYQIETQNCKKITIKKIIDLDGKKLKIDQNFSVPYFKINNLNLFLNSNIVQSKIWSVAQSKVIIRPDSLKITCYNCGTTFTVKISDDLFNCLCKNRDCKKQASVELKKIYLE